MLEAVEGRRFDHRHLGAHLVEDLLDARTPCRIVLAVNAHVEQGEFQLAHHLHGRLEMARGNELVEQRLGQRLARLVVAGEQVDGLFFPAPVLHELAGQFHRVPFHAVDPGDVRIVHPGEHVVQAVAELVEQGDHLVMGEQGRLVAHRRGGVAGHVGDRDLHPVPVPHPVHALVHPGAAALLGPGVEVQVELCAGRAVGITDLVEAHVRMPHVHAVHFHDAHLVEALHQAEQARHNPVHREVGL